MNNPDAIQPAFEDYYQTTILSEETDPNKLRDVRGTLDQHQIYCWEQIDEFVEAFLNGADRSKLNPGLDIRVDEYKKLDDDWQVEFKSSGKAFGRLYSFLSEMLPYGNPNWEKLSIFLSFLVNKLPAPAEENLSRVCWTRGYGELPDGTEGSPVHQPGRGRRRDRPSFPGWRRGSPSARVGPPLRHHQRIQQDLGRQVLRP